jgi:uncharacterized protein (TIGR02598 family)
MSILMPSRPPGQKAFSLIEVVLALGVIAFSLVAILGVFPTGLAANRTSISDTRAAQFINAVTATIDAQCATFSSVNCYGETLNLVTLNTPAAAKLFVSYPSPDEPTISNDPTLSNWIYSIELSFDNDPALTPSGSKLGAGKLNKIQLRVKGKSTSEGFVELFFLARNKG